MIYASVYFTILYKDSQKLEKTRKHRKPMPHNQGVAGSCPAGTTSRLRNFRRAVCIMLRLYPLLVTPWSKLCIKTSKVYIDTLLSEAAQSDAGEIVEGYFASYDLHAAEEIVGDEEITVQIGEIDGRRKLGGGRDCT